MSKTILPFLASILLCHASLSLAENEITVIYPNAQSDRDPRQEYFLDLLELALECTRVTHGDYQLKVYEENLPPSRIPVLVRNDRLINIMSSPVSEFLNTNMHAIPFPLLMGIQGVRVSLVHQDNQQIFAQVNHLNDFKKIIFGQGLGWIDTLILQDANLKVDTSGNYESLFAMLANKRIDALPRGVNEAFAELEQFKTLYMDLVIEPNMAFYYLLPVYFYVSKDNSALGERVFQGLKTAVKEGQFKQLFEQYYASTIAKLNLPNRKLFVLKNNHIPENTGSQVSEYLHPAIKSHFSETNKEQSPQ